MVLCKQTRCVFFLPGIQLAVLSQQLLYSVLCGLQASYWWAHNQSSACFTYTPTRILMWSGVVLRSKQQKTHFYIRCKGWGVGSWNAYMHILYFWLLLLVEVLSKCDGCNLRVQYDLQNQYLKPETLVWLNVCPKISPKEFYFCYHSTPKSFKNLYAFFLIVD